MSTEKINVRRLKENVNSKRQIDRNYSIKKSCNFEMTFTFSLFVIIK